MNQVELKDIIIDNVYQCPNCNSKAYGHFASNFNFINVCCDTCEFESGSYRQLTQTLDSNDDIEGFVEFTRNIFNDWNETVAKVTDQPIVEVQITIK